MFKGYLKTNNSPQFFPIKCCKPVFAIHIRYEALIFDLSDFSYYRQGLIPLNISRKGIKVPNLTLLCLYSKTHCLFFLLMKYLFTLYRSSIKMFKYLLV
jgi:hypothetical protein